LRTLAGAQQFCAIRSYLSIAAKHGMQQLHILISLAERRPWIHPQANNLTSYTGPKAEAEAIKDQLAAFLRDELALELSAEKTLITHARTEAARFLGYEITVRHDNSKITGGRRMLNGTIALRVPLTVVRSKCAPYRRRGKPWCRPALINLSDYDIVRV
ncbi:hypothetical protein, partial [Phytohabitans kaempferiae]